MYLLRGWTAVVFLIVAALGSGCDKKSAATRPAESKEVVLYSSVDEPYLTPLVKQFKDKTGITVTLVTDTEATKTTGLAGRLEAEKDNPRADVYWGNEIFHTVHLAEKGLFAAYRPRFAEEVPPRWRDAKDRFVDIGLRARVIGLSTAPTAKAAVAEIKSLRDLVAPALKDRVALCHPGFGTTAGHMAVLYTVWGEDPYIAWLKGLKANNAKLLGGNSVVADQVAAGTFWAGLTDNDDLANAKTAGGAIGGVLPDQATAEIGTLLLPTTIALVDRAPNATNGKKLIDFLTDATVEKSLIDAKFLGYSVRDETGPKPIQVDYVKAAKNMKKAVELALQVLQER